MTLLDVVLIAATAALADVWPLSADGHFALAPGLITDPVGFAVVLSAARLGAGAGLALWFWRDLWAMASGVGKLVQGKIDPGGRLLLLFLAASLPACIALPLLPQFIAIPHSQQAAAFALLGFGLLLLLADRWGVTIRRIEHTGYLSAALLGLMQIAAILPGASRVGAVITVARLAGFERRDSARLALLLSIPVFSVQSISSLWNLSDSAVLTLSSDLAAAAGLAMIAAWAGAGILMGWLHRHGFAVFALWRIMVAGGVIALGFLAA